MTTRRRPDYLAKTLRAIQRQTMSDFEVVISDNDPLGSAGAVVKGFNDSRFRYFANGADVGMLASFNRSLSVSRGEFVVMITDDDPVYPEMLETLCGLVERYPGYGAYYGGCDVVHEDPVIAKLSHAKVGNNSCLAPLPLGQVRVFSGLDFPRAIFTGQVNGYPLWSVGMVRRKIALEIGGVPDYGTPFLADWAYVVLACSRSGCVIINTSLGCQTVHQQNFGRKEYDQMLTVAEGFVRYLANHMTARSDWLQIKPLIEQFVARWVVSHGLFLHGHFRQLQTDCQPLDAAMRLVFELPYLRRYWFHYHLGRYQLIARLYRAWRELF